MSESEQRDEGGILDWSMLDPQQHAAGCKAHELFVGMANRPYEEPSKGSELFSFLPRLDAHRGNHTVLIDGTRGAGKTAVMLRLLQDWSNALRTGGATKAPLDKPSLQDGGQLVPVGLLDLEAVPQTANLATRIAGMFERVVSAMERRGTKNEGMSSAPTWALLQDDTLKSREKWQSFVGAAALEWDRSLERRRASIDPEAYAVEVEQAERKGLQARECFRAFIDALVKDWKGWHQQEKRPFFIVPIDDADLNPGRVVELFGLLRTLWHPRVGYLLTGDSGLFTHVLTTHFRSQIDMPQLRAPGTLGGGVVRLTDDPSRLAEGLARDLYQKGVPLAQRLKIAPLSAAERLSVVVDVLPRATLMSDNAETLADYLGADDLGALALPGRWRQLIDLRKRLQSGEFEKPFGAERLAYALWCQALDEQPLRAWELRDLQDIVSIDERGRTPVFQGLAAINLSFLSASEERHLSHFGNVIVQSRIVVHGEAGTAQNRIRLGADALASLFLMRNVSRQKPVSGLMPENKFNFMLVEVPFPVRMNDEALVLENTTGTDLVLPFRWPVPAWKQQLEKQRLYRRWEDRLLVFPGTMGELARTFLSLVFEVSGQQVGDSTAWAVLASLIVSEAHLSSTMLGDWAYRSAGLLASPESGLLESDADDWLLALQEKALASNTWSGFRAFLKRARRKRVDFALNEARASAKLQELPATKRSKAVEAIIAEIDRRAPGYKWTSLIEAPTP